MTHINPYRALCRETPSIAVRAPRVIFNDYCNTEEPTTITSRLLYYYHAIIRYSGALISVSKPYAARWFTKAVHSSLPARAHSGTNILILRDNDLLTDSHKTRSHIIIHVSHIINIENVIRTDFTFIGRNKSAIEQRIDTITANAYTFA